MPGQLFEGNPVDEGTTGRSTDAPVHLRNTHRFHTHQEKWCHLHAAAAAAKLLQSCPTLFGPIYHSPPGSPVPGILQARTLEWVAISFSSA